MSYTVQKLATLSGVTVRTLHHYDEIGLLKPAYTKTNGYRYYGEEELLLLQQILFFRKLGFELQKIREIIKKRDFDQIAALHSHRKILVNHLDKTKELIQTIDDTINHLQGKKKMKPNEFFEGLNSPKQEEYETYLMETGKYTREELESGRKRMEKWSKDDWQKVQSGWIEIINGYVRAIKKNLHPRSSEVLANVALHLEWLCRFGIKVKKEGLAEEARSHFDHPDWKMKLDGYHPQLLEFMYSAFEAYENN